MSSMDAAHSKDDTATVVGTTGVRSKAKEADIEAIAGLSQRLASLTTGRGEEERRTASEDNEVTSSTSKEQGPVGSTGQENGDEAGIESSSREAPLMSNGKAGEGQAAAEKHEKSSNKSKEQDGGDSIEAGNRSKKSQNIETPSSSAPPQPTAAVTSAPSVAKKVDDPSRRFAEYRPYVQEGQGPAYSKDWLWKYLDEPREEELEEMVYYEDELCVVIYDRFPKAKYHLLLVAKAKKDIPVKQPTDLSREDLAVQRRLHDAGRTIAEELSRQGAGAVRCGYHAIPQAEPMHMHIISQDFDSLRLKAPKHWNSFTTDFFLDCSWIETRLEELGSLELNIDKYTKLEYQPVKCFRCGWAASVKSLKKHNLECTALLPGVGAPEGRGKCT